MPRPLSLLFALLLGASLTFGYAPFSLWPLVPLALAGFIYLLSKVEPEMAGKLGFSFGLGWFGAGISWVHVSIADFGGIPLVASIGLMLLLSAYLAIYPALVSHFIKKYFVSAYWPLALPFIWLLFESLRAWLFTGFPWLSLGYSQLHSPLAGWFPVIGEFGVSALVILLSTSLGLYLTKTKYSSALIITSVVYLSGWVLNQHQWSSALGEPVPIAMVQGNIEQSMRWAPEQDAPTMQ